MAASRAIRTQAINVETFWRRNNRHEADTCGRRTLREQLVQRAAYIAVLILMRRGRPMPRFFKYVRFAWNDPSYRFIRTLLLVLVLVWPITIAMKISQEARISATQSTKNVVLPQSR